MKLGGTHTPGGSLGRPLKGYPQRSSCEPFTASTFQALGAPTPYTPPVGGAGWGGGFRVVDGSTCPFIGSWCSLVWERRTTCWVTMRVPDPNILVVRRLPPFREGRDLDHHVSACSEGARACWGGAGCRACFWSGPISVGGVGAAKGQLFPGLQGEPAHGLHPRFVVAEIWADRARRGGGGGRHVHNCPIWAAAGEFMVANGHFCFFPDRQFNCRGGHASSLWGRRPMNVGSSTLRENKRKLRKICGNGGQGLLLEQLGGIVASMPS